MLPCVVDDDFQFCLELREAPNDLRLAEIISNDTNLCLFVDCLIEQAEDCFARFEAHPGESLFLLWMRGLEGQAVLRVFRNQSADLAKLLELFHKCLRSD